MPEPHDPPMVTPTPPHPVLTEYYANPEDRQSFVGALFDAAAEHYNRIGHMLDLGSGAWYRRWTLRRTGLRPGMRLLDVATGTGLVARGGARIVGRRGGVIGVDPSRGMLQQARKALSSPLVQGRAEALPFREGLFDMLSMGFALRHVADLDVAFAEYRRVVKPGGRLLLLELSRPSSSVARALFRAYFQYVVPRLTRIGTRNRSAQLLMEYYWDTMDRCVPPETILDAMRRTGFIDVHRRVLFGILSEYTATKPHS
jgi:demethylmenaquinone methyltransferase/2-methoxy-6-polyprenyl-1,4-benzoquinol methylase